MTKQWPPKAGLPDPARYKKATDLEWGETPFDTLDRAELLRLVQAYHSAAKAARFALWALSFNNKNSLFWGADGNGGEAVGRLEYLIQRAGDGGADEASETIYRSFFRYADGLLFAGAPVERWGITNDSDEMWSPFVEGQSSPFGKEGRPITWDDLLPKKV